MITGLIVILGVYAWGQNNNGQMGIVEPPNTVIMMRNFHKELSLVAALKNKNVVQIAAGGYHSLALTGKLKCHHLYKSVLITLC